MRAPRKPVAKKPATTSAKSNAALPAAKKIVGRKAAGPRRKG